MRKVAALVLLALVGACAPKIVPAPVVSTPKFPDFVAPALPTALAGGRAAVNQDRGWRFLQVGDLRNAEREFVTALATSPAFYPAETALGYVELARKNAKAALPHFDRTLERQAQDVSALVGRGQALVALSRDAEGLAAFEAAVASDASLSDLRRQVEVLRFRVLGQDLTRARQASAAGRVEEAAAAYEAAIAGSPDSPVLYRELAGVDRRKGDLDRALEHFRKAVALDAGDAGSLMQIGEILDDRGDLAGAESAYAAALSIESSDVVTARLEAVRERVALARLPEEYRAIEHAPQMTRGDLAALVGVRLAPLLQAGGHVDAVVITDVRAHWAATWIMAVARAGVMEPFSNHTFQPRMVVRRVDFAQVVSRLLTRIAAGDPVRAKPWDSARMKFSDLSPGHLEYSAASAAVAAGIMTAGASNSFQPFGPVSGSEAMAAIDRLQVLAGTQGKTSR